MHWPLTG